MSGSRGLQGLLQAAALFGISLLEGVPPLTKSLQVLAGLFTQQQKIESRTEALVGEQAFCALATAFGEAELQFPDFPHRKTDALGNGYSLQLAVNGYLARILQLRD
jgi:hypothetical protein